MNNRISLRDLDLPFEASSDNHAIKAVGNRIIVGYLTDDYECPNPLDDEAMGHVVEADSRSEKQELYSALGLDSDGEKDLSWSAVETEAEQLFKEIVKRDFTGDLAVYLLTESTRGVSTSKAMQNLLYDFREAVHPKFSLTEKLVDSNIEWERLLDDAWTNCRAGGRTGNPDAVSLDCYEHDGKMFVVNGHANMYHDLTSAIWIPDKYLTNDYLGMYPIGSPERQQKALEYASQAVEVYNKWLAGERYGVIVAQFENIAAPGDDPEWEFVSSDESWGHIGHENALAEIESSVDIEVTYLVNTLAIAPTIQPRSSMPDLQMAA